jgi:hypothetical protein
MERRLLILGLVAVAAFAQIHTAAAQSNSPPFPRLGAYLIGGGIDFANVPNIGKLNMAVLTFWPGWSVGGKNAAQQVAAVKALNPNIVLTGYIKIEEVSPGDQAFATEYNTVNANNWWARAPWPSGSIVLQNSGTPGAYAINNTTFTNVVNGQNYLQWKAAFDLTYNPVTASPPLDGIYIDDVYWAPRVNADWNQDGVTESSTNATAQQWYRSGYAAYVGYLRSAMPAGKTVWGNVADWSSGPITGYNQLLNGGVMEHIIPGIESSGWLAMMNYYKLVMNATAPPQYQVFQHDTSSSTDYQAMRYGLASCLLDNGYYWFDTDYRSVLWFDEFNFNLGAAIAGPNNPTNGTYSNGGLTVWKQGVWRRDFTNGIALVNPKGNGVQTVTLETTYKHLAGTQDPSVNNGQSVTSVTLNDRDGVILLGTATAQQPVPDAPTLSVQ